MKCTKSRGASSGWAGWAIAHPVFGKIEGAAAAACHITTCLPSFSYAPW